MSQLFVGDRHRLDPKVVQAVGGLGPAHVILAEFDMNRHNVDVCVFRPYEAAPTSIIVTEVKAVSRTLWGTDNGPWYTRTASGDLEPMLGSGRDGNPHRQAVATADALGDWLWNHRRLYSDRLDQEPREMFSPWPTVLLLAAGQYIRHELPDGPSSQYGTWHFSIDDWARSVATWRPRKPRVELTAGEIERIAEVLTLERLELGPNAGTLVSVDPDGLVREALESLTYRMHRFEQRLSALEAQDAPVSLGGYRNVGRVDG